MVKWHSGSIFLLQQPLEISKHPISTLEKCSHYQSNTTVDSFAYLNVITYLKSYSFNKFHKSVSSVSNPVFNLDHMVGCIIFNVKLWFLNMIPSSSEEGKHMLSLFKSFECRLQLVHTCSCEEDILPPFKHSSTGFRCVLKLYWSLCE